MNRVLGQPSGLPRRAAEFSLERIHLIALALFLAVGISAVDDYGVVPDTVPERVTGNASLDYILGDEDALMPERRVYNNHLYAVAFPVALAAIERVPWVGEDSRRAVLSRHLTTHLFFLVGGFFAWLLAYRLFGSRAAALIAMLLFLLHPRIYAHSFFNSKDAPFISMFMIALYLIHRAFRRDSVWAFALCGAGVGLLANIRVLGIMLFAAVLGMLAWDAVRALTRGGDARRVIAHAAAFSLAAALALYATFPILWSDPLNIIAALAVMTRHPFEIHSLFQGEWVSWPNLPWSFIPVWALITTPPVALVLAAVGLASAARLCARRWRNAMDGGTERFFLLLVGCAALPVLAAIILNINVYDDWRHMFFIYAPTCILAAFGFRSAVSLSSKRGFRIAAHVAVLAALAVVAAQMVGLHPYQNDYFNALVNRADPERLGNRYAMDYAGVSRREALEFLLDAYPNRHIALDDRNGSAPAVYAAQNLWVIPKEDRRRVAVNRVFPDFTISKSAESPIWSREIYGVPIAAITDSRADSRAAHRAVYETARSMKPLARSGFDIYTGEDDAGSDALIYVKEPCAEQDARGRFYVRLFPAHPDDLGEDARAGGVPYNALRFDFLRRGALYGGVCVMRYSLPRYPVRAFETGQTLADGEPPSWSAAFEFDKPRAAYAAAMSAEPAIESVFDVYIDGRSLTYVKDPCAEEDARGRFQLWAFPEHGGALWMDSERGGAEYESLNFDFRDYGAIFDGRCVIARTLPSYPMTHIEIGQWTPGEGGLWSARINFEAGVERYMRIASEMSARRPAIESGYDVYLEGDILAYVKDPCEEGDTAGRFFLSVTPANEGDLSDDSRERGLTHNALNFDFDRYGVLSEGGCVIVRTLPDYPISRLETGQWIPGEGGRLWSGEITVSE